MNLAAGKTPCWAGATPVFGRVPWPTPPVGSLRPNEIGDGCLPAGCTGFQSKQGKKKADSSEEFKNFRLHFRSCHVFTRWRSHGTHSQRLATTGQAKVAAHKSPKRAGATPLFPLPAAQKVRGVAPAVVSRGFARLQEPESLSDIMSDIL